MNKKNFDFKREEIEELYIKQNLSKEDVAKKLNITLWSLSNLFKRYNIKKSKELIAEKRTKTNIAKYGVDNVSKSDYIRKKIIDSNKKKYGANSFTATEAGKKQIKTTKKIRYGDEKYNNNEKAHITKAIKYNNENYNNREKYKKTMLDEYSVDNGFKLINKESAIDDLIKRKKYNEEFKKYISDRNNSIEFLKDKNYNYLQLANYFNAPYYVIQNWVFRLNLREYINYNFEGKSHYEDEIISFIYSLGINNVERNTKKYLNNQEIDIYLPDFNIGIEFNGTYWHSDLYKDKNYHYKKSLLAQDKDIRLIHIYQYEWDDELTRNKIKSLLKIALNKPDRIIYARNCIVKELTNKKDRQLAKDLNNAVHLQGDRKAKVVYGLFYNDELVQLMSFSHNKKYEWEIIRGCPGSNNIVIGGVSKLFKHFVQDYKPKEVFSYCDFNKFDGKSYETLGMKFIGYTGPDLKYIIGDKVINRQPSRYKEIKNMIDARIYGAGSKKYLWTKNVY